MKSLILSLLIVSLHSETLDVRMMFDFKDSSQKTVEIVEIKGETKVRIYTTAEDVTEFYRAVYINGEVKHYIKKRK